MPEIVTLVNVQIGVQPGEGEQVNLIVIDPATAKQYVVPLDPEAAKNVGQSLTAPRVVQAPQNIVLPR